MSDIFRDVFRNEVIRASAGTGKTFALSNRFLRLLASGAECETILATTFTRKAAGEILDRIVQRLAKAALNEDEATILAQQLDWKMDKLRAQDLLRELIENLHRLQISTLDAFFYRIAQSFRLELGLPTQWQIVTEQQMQALQHDTVREILREKTVIDLLHLMNKGEAQRGVAALISNTVNRLYDIRRQSEREAWTLLEPDPTFKHERDFSEHVEQLLSFEYPDKRFLTAIKKEIVLIEQRDWLKLASASIFTKVLNQDLLYYKKAIPPECCRVYGELIDHCRGFVIDMLIRKNSSTFDLLDEFGKEMEAEKTAAGRLRFEDITRRLEDFIRDRNTDDFDFRLDHTVNHLLLDEFQDTSIAQWNVVQPFAARTTEPDDNRSFFCVGDLKQAIFGWRGGVAEIFDSVECSLSNMSEAPPLTKSYRSSQVIIDVVNEVFGNLDKFQVDDNAVANEAVLQWAAGFGTHKTDKADLPGFFELEFAAENKEKYPDRNRKRNEDTLVTAVHRISQLHEAMPDRSIGVLVRKNQTIGELIFMLRGAGISASEEGGNPLTDSAAVEILLSLMTLADHPGDGVARYHLSHSPLAETLGLEPETKQNQWENVSAAGEAAEELRAELLSHGLGFTTERYARQLAETCTKRELSRLQQLVQEAFNFERAQDQPRMRLRVENFVKHIRHEFRASDESSAQVRVMTIHQSKGLEFDVVVLPMLFEERGWFGSNSEVIVGRDHPTSPINLVSRLVNSDVRNLLPENFRLAFDENRRRVARDNLCVLYVAMTRAIHATHVVMSYGCKTDKPDNSSVLLSTLHPGDRSEGPVYTHGDRDWYQKLAKPKAAEELQDSALQPYYLAFDATLSAATLAESSPTGRGMERTSPSRLEGGDKVLMSSIFSMMAKDSELQYGNLIHACFELVTWLDEQSPTRRQLKSHLRALDMTIDEAEIDRTIDRFLKLIKQPEIVKLLSRQTFLRDHAGKQLESTNMIFDALRVEVKNERGFAVSINGQLLQGFIDRLVLTYEGDKLLAAEVIDYKTDAVEGEALQSRINHYRPQLNAYRQATARFCKLPLERVSAQLVFVAQDLIVDLDETSEAASPPLLEKPDPEPSKPKTKTPKIKKPKLNSRQQMKFWE